MNKVIKIVLLLLFIFPAALFFLAQLGLFSGRRPTDLGAIDNRLKAPSQNPNSISSQAHLYSQSEADVEYARAEPISYKGQAQIAFAKLKEVIHNFFPEAELIEEKEKYLRYEFKTNLMKYIDDVEFLLVESENQIHFRSASRLGRKDFGKNRRRMIQIQNKFLEFTQ